ncbi:programmed cell death protein 2 isoform X2 [Chiloscyllium plagiosum]|uniref:programmed cell death protein 2 isoform X2 n=1 Tax=Chiloscyllium plagiosum TaxID=36176 RepID=UPI001CB84871|nr:programmed cell death protein 2 isoform X2 [Chiloscyllium plagiosum]
MEALGLAMASDGEASALVELGFVEPAPAARLLSSQFPSKVGGRPAWLSLQLPEPERLRCGGCARPMIFLLQVYAPRGRAFHRTLLVFCCAHSPCPRRRFAVFRSQLGRVNEFYSPQPQPQPQPEPEPEPQPEAPRPGPRLCRVCGASGPKSCSRCRWAHYCGKEHQSLDWKAGHREACGQALDCVTEGLAQEELEAMAKHESKEDRIFAKFKRRIALAPDQVLRYCRGGSPLWVSEENVPSDVDIPSCACGAKREFEFQVMPQLLNHLKMDSFGESLDWGTLVVYTCEQNCDHGNEYSAECIWKQDFSADHL